MSEREYQNEAIDWLCKTRRGIVKCPAGGGKTRIASTAIDRVARSIERAQPAKVTWLANTNEQVEQAIQALAMFPAIAQLCRMRVKCWQSAIDCSEEDLLVVDECHHAAAPTLAAMVAKSPGARWGLSATPLGTDPDKNMAMLKLFDCQMCEVKRERVVEGGHLTKARVLLHNDTDDGITEAINAEVAKLLPERMAKFYRRELSEIEELKRKITREGDELGTVRELLSLKESAYQQAKDEQRKRITWQLCQTLGIVSNSLRNRRIVSLCGGYKEQAVLILVGTVEHGNKLAAEIPGSVVCHSGMGAKKRRLAIAGFRNGELGCMISTSLCDEGFDAPRAAVLIMACAGRSPTKAEQRTGRVLRLFEGKTHGIIHDFIDTQHPMLASQSKARQRTYKKLGYEFAK